MTTEREWKALYDRGWSLVPCKPDKRPYVDWTIYQYQRASWETIKGWLSQYPNPNPAVVTGRISNIIVMDQDGVEGSQSILQAGALPDTPKVKTARGAHYYFTYPTIPEGSRVKSRAGVLPGLDSKADGGYVIAAGAVHQSGNRYEWESDPDSRPFARAPQWWLDLVITEEPDPVNMARDIPVHIPSNGNGNGQGRDRNYVLAALKGEAEKIAGTPDGTKHDRLLYSAIAVGGFAWAIPEQEIEQVLYEAVAPRAADKRAARITIRDGIEYGSHRPREIPPPKHPVPHLTLVSPGQPPPDIPGDNSEPNQPGDDGGNVLITAPLTDAGNAECMVQIYGQQFRYDCNKRDQDGWLMWDGNKWSTCIRQDVYRAALNVIRLRQAATADIVDPDRKKKAFAYLVGCENDHKQRALLSAASRHIHFATYVSDYDRDQWLAGTPDGTFDFRKGHLRPPERSDLITMSLGAAFDPEAEAPRWEQFLREVFAGDEELITFIQRAAGYSLTGDTREQCLFLCHGSGANGKSVFLDILGKLAGDYAGNAAFTTFDAERRSEATNDLASLRGKRLVTVIEAEEDRRLAEARIKAVTGQDPITCRFLWAQFFTYTPTYKLWMAMNHKPIIRGTDRGIWRRIRLIPFTQTFEGKEDKRLAQTLHAELPGILNWALTGMGLWLRDGLGTASVVEAATEEYRRESDLVGQWFEDCCASAPASTTLASDAYNSFRARCKDYGFREPTQTSLSRSLVERGYERIKLRGQRQYVGFMVLDPLTRQSEH